MHQSTRPARTARAAAFRAIRNVRKLARTPAQQAHVETFLQSIKPFALKHRTRRANAIPVAPRQSGYHHSFTSAADQVAGSTHYHVSAPMKQCDRPVPAGYEYGATYAITIDSRLMGHVYSFYNEGTRTRIFYARAAHTPSAA